MNLAVELITMDKFFEREFRGVWPGLKIISGFRTPQRNDAVGGVASSRHLLCPSTAADLRVGGVEGLESAEVWTMLGGYWKLHGGRWGGDFGNPDLNHFDLG